MQKICRIKFIHTYVLYHTSIIIWCKEIFFFCDFCHFVHHQTTDRPRLSHSKHTMMCGYRLCWHKTFSLDYIIEKRLCSRYLIQNIRRRRHTKNGLWVWPFLTTYLPNPSFPIWPGSFHRVLISKLTCLNLIYTVVRCVKAAKLMSWLNTDLSGAKTPVSLM